MTKIQEFEIGMVISATTGYLVARGGYDALHDFFEFITGGPVWSHQFPRLMAESQEDMFEQFPWLRHLEIPEDLNGANWHRWLDQQAAVYGASLKVKQLPPGTFTERQPIDELAEAIGTEAVKLLKVPNK